MVCVCVVRIQLQRVLELLLRSNPIHSVSKKQGQRGMSLSGLRVDFNGFERRCIGLWKRLGGRSEAVPCESAITVPQSRVSCAVGWIHLDCLLEINGRFLHPVASPLVPIEAAFQVSLVCRGL